MESTWSASLRNAVLHSNNGLKALTRTATENADWRDLIVYRDTVRHPTQHAFIGSDAKRIIVRAGRRGGKTVGMAQKAVRRFARGQRVLYAAPTAEQIDRFWYEVTTALAEPVTRKLLYKNETEHVIEMPNTLNRIRAKTAWNADTLRGDYGDFLIFDEWQLMDEEAWDRIGMPMLLDNNGDAAFIYTPPSLASRAVSKARDPRHAAKLFQRAARDDTGLWETYHFASHDNPYISPEALELIATEMTETSYKQEILALDEVDVPGALWRQAEIDALRVTALEAPTMRRIVVAIDPMGESGSAGAEAGIIVAGVGTDGHFYVLEDLSLRTTPDGWARAAVQAYYRWQADRIVAETNYGGQMVESTVRTVDKNVPLKLVTSTRGKLVRAEPIAALYEQKRAHPVGEYPQLETELTTYTGASGQRSPNRCFPAGTFVTTDRGDVPIEQLKQGDFIWTRAGFKRALTSGITSPCSRLVRLTLSCGIILECTPDHPVFTFERGFVPAWTITRNEHLSVIASKLSNTTAWNTTVIPTAPIKQQRDTSPRLETTNEPTISPRFIGRYGKRITERFLRVRKFITSIATGITTTFRIWNALPPSSIVNFMLKRSRKSVVSIWPRFARLLVNGTPAQRGEYGMLNMLVSSGTGAQQTENLLVRSAGTYFNPSSADAANYASVLESASIITTNERSVMNRNGFAKSAAPILADDLSVNLRYVLSNVNNICESKRQAVYNLTVEGEHEYFANGVLVHNCDALVFAGTELMLGNAWRSDSW